MKPGVTTFALGVTLVKPGVTTFTLGVTLVKPRLRGVTPCVKGVTLPLAT